jgi:hypothetical protein
LDTKLVAFVTVSVILVGAIYSSSAYFVFGVTDTVCVSTSKTTTFCQVIEDDKVVLSMDCKKNPDGKTWRCDQAKSEMTGGSIPPELTDALDVATQDIQANDTKVPKTGILSEPGALSDDGSDEDGEDTEVPKDPGGLNDEDDAPTINPGLP